jgi:hypothetical protein
MESPQVRIARLALMDFVLSASGDACYRGDAVVQFILCVQAQSDSQPGQSDYRVVDHIGVLRFGRAFGLRICAQWIRYRPVSRFT